MDQPKKAKKKPLLVHKKELGEQYGVYMNAYGGYANDPKEKPIVEIVEKVAKFVDLVPSYMYTIMIGEGLGYIYISGPEDFEDGKLITDRPISGFTGLGLDFFSHPDEYPRFKKYLPNDFNEGDEFEAWEATRKERYGEEKVPSAIFDNMENAVHGFGAVLKHRQELFLRQSKAMGYLKPTADEKAYWSYYYFQAEGDAKRALEDREGLDIKKSTATSRKSIHIKALERVAAWRYVQHYGIFSE